MAYDDISELIDLETTALVVVDVQNAFAAPDSPLRDAGLDVGAAVETVPRVKQLLSAARDAGLTVAFTRSLRRDDGRDAPQNVYDVLPAVARSGDPICCSGDPDAEYVEGVEPREGEYEVGKIRYNAFHDTPLEYYLRSEGVETVLMCGFTTNVCVEGTARGAHERGFDVVLVEDCCASFTEEQHESGVRNVELILGTTTTLSELTSGLLPAPTA